MKKFLLSFSVIFVFAAYVVYQRAGNAAHVIYVASLNNKSNSKPDVSVPETNPETKIANGLYKDGQYTGNIADAYYGNVQVKAIISNGKIADVIFLDHPHVRDNSVRINERAMPLLKTESIQIQDSQVDTVSGASLTSEAFRESLAVALAQAKN